MEKRDTVLFDFDGVLADTEPLYDEFWNDAARRYRVGIDNFASKIKGTTMPMIMQTYFSAYPEEVRQQLLQESKDFETQLAFPPVAGALAFLRLLKENGIKIGLVTSSEDCKIRRAFDALSLHGVFDTVVTADRITKGKPDPMCYLLAASDLHKKPEACLVFEDSFAGIAAATAAGMRVIGLSTTNPVQKLKEKVYAVIPDFEKVDVATFDSWR